MEPTKLRNIIMSVLFASEEPVSTRKLCAIVDDAEPKAVHAAIDEIRELLKTEMPSIMLDQVGGGLQLATNPEYAAYVARIYSGKRKHRLSRAAMETIAIIAYKQPITRADIENVRGVGAGGVITTLMERNLIRITGKAKVLGAPFLYGTTSEFLEYLGINSLKDLPTMDELEKLLEREESAAEEAAIAEQNEMADGDDGDGETAGGETAPDEDLGFSRVDGDVDDVLLGAAKDPSGERPEDSEAYPVEAEEVAERDIEKQPQTDEPI